MEYTQIVKHAWHTAWRYRALWILGVVLALTATSWAVPMSYGRSREENSGGRLVYVAPDESRVIIPEGNGDTSEGGDVILNYKHQADDWPFRKGDTVINYNPPSDFSVSVASIHQDGRLALKTLEIRPGIVALVVALGIGLVSLVVLLSVASRVARYVAETALIRMVDEVEETGERRGVWHGIKMGWSHSAWRLFVINLLVNIVGIVASILLFVAILAPLPLWVQGREAVIFLMAFVTGSLFFLAIALVVVISAVLSAFKRIAWRACIVEELGVLGAIGQAYRVVRSHFKDTGLVWLISCAVRWGWRMAMVPIAIGLVGVALLAGSLPALVTGGLASLVTSGDLPVFLALGVGIPIFIVVLAAPLLLLGGLREAFLSALWTLSYRELRPLESVVTRPAPDTGASGVETASALA